MDHATFDRLTRLLAGGASRRHTLRAIIAAALAGGTAEELLAARKRKDKAKARNEKKDGDSNRDDRDRDEKRSSGDGKADRVAAQGKNKNNKNKKKRKRKKKRNNTGGNTGGNRCAGTPLRPGQNFLGCDFSGDNLRGKDLHSATFKDVDLSDANLCGANLESTSFADSDLSDANLSFVNLDSSSYSKTSFAGANLTGATFRVATFSKVNFSGANLAGVDLTGANIADTDFSGATFCRTVQPDGRLDNRDCDICENVCGVCKDCDDKDCTAPDCCPNPEGPGGVCVDTDTDPLNCGGCDRACFTNLANACVDGKCVCGDEPECSGDDTCCRAPGGATRCVDTDNDLDNCGSCNVTCLIPTNPCLAVECRNGECVEVPVGNGSPCEVDEAEGVCCASGNTSTCVVDASCCTDAQCDASEACCEGQCVDVQDDPNNCGGCGEICETSLIACLSNQCINGGCLEVFAEDGEPCEDGGSVGICCFNVETSLCIVDVRDNFDHCGGCLGCDPEKADACVEGVCVCGDTGAGCGAHETCCDGQCVNTSTDRDNCGACNEICVFPENPCFGSDCVGGSCQQTTLPDGTVCVFGELDGVCCGGSCDFGFECCTDAQCGAGQSCCGGLCFPTANNFEHCGACNNACLPTRSDTCEAGVCMCGENLACAENETCCSGQCINTDTDFDNCGGCGDTCFANADTCSAGECVCGELDFSCPEGDLCCGGACIDSGDDRANCGACGNTCETDEFCDAGTCTRCPGHICGNTCISLLGCCDESMCPFITCRTVVACTDHECIYANDPDGDPCFDARGVCQTGQCVCGAGGFCPSGQSCCNGQCVNTDTDGENCGACGEVCGASLDLCITTECIAGECASVASAPGAFCSDGSGVCCLEGETITCEVGAACCTLDQCPALACQTAIACDANQCVYENLPDETACINGGVCVAGQCRCGAGPACESGSTCCTNQCIDTSSDRFNCGICGFECVDGICSGGECVACEGIPCGDQCLEPPACCTVDDCLGQTCKVKTGCSAEHECLYDNAPAGTPCGFGECDSEGNCIGG
jgi:hypothetical protein